LKEFAEFTSISENNYAQLYRPKDGPTALKTAYGKKEVKHSNRWVVPYNPSLLVALDSHVNVEVCASIRAIKYLYKYVFKGWCVVATYKKNVSGLDKCLVELSDQLSSAGDLPAEIASTGILLHPRGARIPKNSFEVSFSLMQTSSANGAGDEEAS